MDGRVSMWYVQVENTLPNQLYLLAFNYCILMNCLVKQKHTKVVLYIKTIFFY